MSEIPVDSHDDCETVDVPETFEERYDKARRLFEKGDFRASAESARDLMSDLLFDVIKTHFMELSRDSEFTKVWSELCTQAEDLKGTRFRDLWSLFDNRSYDLFRNAGFKDQVKLLETFTFEYLADFVLWCDSGANNPSVKLGVQQLLCATVAVLLAHRGIAINEYHLLANFSQLRKELDYMRANYDKRTGLVTNFDYLKVGESDVGAKKFRWLKRQGMLLNESDKSRNIALKVETLVSILGTVYRDFEERLGRHEEESDLVTRTILCNAGYESGSRFGWAMVEQFQEQAQDEEFDLRKKIEKWCEFDSDVGFGMFELDGDLINSETPTITIKSGSVSTEEQTYELSDADDGEIRVPCLSFDVKLWNNFVVYKKSADEPHLCSFTEGYIQGVLEKISGQPLKILHPPTECQQFVAGREFCLFRVRTDGEALAASIQAAEERHSKDVEPTRGPFGFARRPENELVGGKTPEQIRQLEQT